MADSSENSKRYSYRRGGGSTQPSVGDSAEGSANDSSGNPSDGSEVPEGDLYRCNRFDCRSLEPFPLSAGGVCPRCKKDDKITKLGGGAPSRPVFTARPRPRSSMGSRLLIPVATLLILGFGAWMLLPDGSDGESLGLPKLSGLPPEITIEIRPGSPNEPFVVRIRNDGSGELLIDSISATPEQLFIITPPSLTLPPGKTESIQIGIAQPEASEIDSKEGSLSLRTNDPSGSLKTARINLVIIEQEKERPEIETRPGFDRIDENSTILKTATAAP